MVFIVTLNLLEMSLLVQKKHCLKKTLVSNSSHGFDSEWRPATVPLLIAVNLAFKMVLLWLLRCCVLRLTTLDSQLWLSV